MSDARIEVKFLVMGESRRGLGRNAAGGTWLHARGSDLSAHGLFIESAQIFPPETRMRVALLGERVLLLDGHVSWARATGVSGMGVVFDNVTRDASLAIGRGLTKRRRARR